MILAGVAIAGLTNSGLFSKSKEARDTAKIANMYEALSLKIVEMQMEKQGNVTLEDFDELNGGTISQYKVKVENNSIETPSRQITLTDDSEFSATFSVNKNLEISSEEVLKCQNTLIRICLICLTLLVV